MTMRLLHLCLLMIDPPPHFDPPSVYLYQEPRTTSPVSRNPFRGKCPPLSFIDRDNLQNPRNTTHSTINRKKSVRLWSTARQLSREGNCSTRIGIWTISRRKESPNRRYRSRLIPKENPWFLLPWDLDRGCLPSPSFLLALSLLFVVMLWVYLWMRVWDGCNYRFSTGIDLLSVGSKFGRGLSVPTVNIPSVRALDRHRFRSPSGPRGRNFFRRIYPSPLPFFPSTTLGEKEEDS